ncbi:glycosyltransferase family 2 protein [Candidatus Pelagibacter sp.]|nr:glycosyltransferase family 2 protein [Candidatus Pelagibacter sp.]
MNNPKSISLMFPLYKDKRSVKKMISGSLKILKRIKKKYEIIIVDDGCPEKSGKIALKYANKNSKIKVFFHNKNLGYGAAIRTGLKKSKYDCIFAIDGDGEYDLNDLPRLLKKYYDNDLVITYRYKKKYKTTRIFISYVYNKILRILFKTNFKDISTGSRLINRKLVKRIKLTSTSPFLGAELAIKAKYLKFKVDEIGIHTYPRTFGTGSSVSIKNIILTIRDMIILYIKLCFKKKLNH